MSGNGTEDHQTRLPNSMAAIVFKYLPIFGRRFCLLIIRFVVRQPFVSWEMGNGLAVAALLGRNNDHLCWNSKVNSGVAFFFSSCLSVSLWDEQHGTTTMVE